MFYRHYFPFKQYKTKLIHWLALAFVSPLARLWGCTELAALYRALAAMRAFPCG
jgi:hypothetical protein